MMRRLGMAVLAVGMLGATGAFGAQGAAETPARGESRELLVRFEAGAAQASALSEIGGGIVERLPRGLLRIRLDGSSTVAEAEALLERRPDVRYAGPNRRFRLFATPADTYFPELWGLRQISAPEAWDLTTGSDSVTVAVVDSGVDYTHPDLGPDNIWANAAETANLVDDDGNGLVDDVRGWDFLSGDNAPLDVDGHGTHVAGTIGARGNNSLGVTGVNWRVKVLPLRAGDETNGLAESAIVSSFAYACAKGAKVINGSFGGDVYSPTIHDAIAACPGALFVFAAGNGGEDGLGDNNDLAGSYPCNDQSPNVLCVAATGRGDTLSSFSNFGPNTVDLAAPGEGILSTVPGSAYAFYDGTSMAAPHVSGVAALVWAQRPALRVDEVRRSIVLGVDPKPQLARLVGSGGRLNAFRALTQDVQPPTGLAAASSTPTSGAWSNVPAVSASWAGAVDASGIDGYSYVVSPVATLVPDEVKEVEETITSVNLNVPDGVHWFHVRARDGAGNWGDAVHVGPIMVDTFRPVRPVASSPSHAVGRLSSVREIVAAWSGAADEASGLDGYSVLWSPGSAVTPDETKDLEETVARTTSARLAPGVWWFNIRGRDNAGNWAESVSLGPFTIRIGPTVCAVPRLRGLTLLTARRQLVKRGCAIGRVTRTGSRRVARGRVVGQRPAPGLRLRRGTRVAVVLSRGRR